jgi:hypothetical protein
MYSMLHAVEGENAWNACTSTFSVDSSSEYMSCSCVRLLICLHLCALAHMPIA